MPRTTYFHATLALALGVMGCAHCETCDDFPAPAYGPPPGHVQHVVSGAPIMTSVPGAAVSTVTPQGQVVSSPAATTSSQPGSPAVTPSSDTGAAPNTPSLESPPSSEETGPKPDSGKPALSPIEPDRGNAPGGTLPTTPPDLPGEGLPPIAPPPATGAGTTAPGGALTPLPNP